MWVRALSLLKKSKKKRIDAFLKWLEKWKDDEVETFQKKKFNPEVILDKYDCLVVLCEESANLEEVKARIDTLFDDTEEENLIVLSSVHRSKGLERDDVFLLKWTFRLWFDAIEDVGIEKPNEEMNIAYVAATRSKQNLYLVHKAL